MRIDQIKLLKIKNKILSYLLSKKYELKLENLIIQLGLKGLNPIYFDIFIIIILSLLYTVNDGSWFW